MCHGNWMKTILQVSKRLVRDENRDAANCGSKKHKEVDNKRHSLIETLSDSIGVQQNRSN
ncbi:hypothetical protein MAR_001672 [Mya arenaria]|uniref:Uncharacterized protein n=1 Tax=Mya arenaria TaxID=6604 RepID=A0ABY7FG35_MYAAR|nr:hypothetical protein MAR_001672 [Mya arenaria]